MGEGLAGNLSQFAESFQSQCSDGRALHAEVCRFVDPEVLQATRGGAVGLTLGDFP